jgi:hypothetical protein
VIAIVGMIIMGGSDFGQALEIRSAFIGILPRAGYLTEVPSSAGGCPPLGQ